MRWDKNAHKSHAERIWEYYCSNKYYFTEQLKDALIDAEEALLELSRDDETVCHCNLKENAELVAKILDADADGKVYGNHIASVGKMVDPDNAVSVVRCRVCAYMSTQNLTNGLLRCRLTGRCHADDYFCADGTAISGETSATE